MAQKSSLWENIRANWDWSKLLKGIKRPLLTIIATALLWLAEVEPSFAFLGGLGAERIIASLEFMFSQ